MSITALQALPHLRALLSLLDDLNETPSLILGNGTCLHDLNAVSDIAGVIFIVSLKLDRSLTGGAVRYQQ